MAARGSCLCGAIEFELTGTPLGVTHCHCSRCRKTRGTGHATNLLAKLDDLRFVRGEELVVSYRPPGAKYFQHAFCKECGSTMPRFDHERGFTIFPMGAFDDDPGVLPHRHIYVASKAPWDLINDELPSFPAGPPTL